MGSIAENILALRKQRGLSQTELAEKIGISRQAGYFKTMRQTFCGTRMAMSTNTG